MKSKKDISDLIRDNQHKLDERPNPRAWQKLEEKLDQHEGKGKKPTRILLYRRLAFAAAIAALVAVISILNTQSSFDDMAKMEANISPQDQFSQGLEPIYSKENNDVRQVIEFQRKLKERYANPIQEGMQTKKLKASNKIITTRSKETNSSISYGDQYAVNDKPNGNVAVVEDENTASNITMTFDDADVEEAEVVEEVTVTLDAAPDVAMAEPASPPVAAPAPEMSADVIASKPRMAKKSRTESKEKDTDEFLNKVGRTSGIQNFNWMVGDWIGSEKTLNILLLNSSDLVSSDFRIKQIGNELFFVDETNLTFELIRSTDNQYIFEQKNKDQIIIKKIDDLQFSKTLVKFNSGRKIVEVYKKK